MLHVGCGDVDASGYVNVDARKMPHVHFVIHDLRDLEFIPPCSFDLVYMCHVLEHVGHLEVGSVLRTVSSILKPDGIVRVAVPDFDLIIDVYEKNGRNMDSVVGVLMGGQDYPENKHLTAFNSQSLTRLLARSGFRDVTAWNPENADHHDFDDTSSRPYEYQGRRYAISLNLEAIKV